jgi:hypothetical protein
MSEGPKPRPFQFDIQDVFFVTVIAAVAGLLLRAGATNTVVLAWLAFSSIVVWIAIRARQPE